MTDLVDRTAREQLAELSAGRVSARELLDAATARNDAVHARLNAVVATDVDGARAAAAAVDEARASGAELGPLAGLPMTIKDGIDVRGLPAVCGNPALVGRSPDVPDADVVAAVRDAGAVVWGKTNVPLMLGDMQTFNAVHGTTNNPFDETRTPGGSSGGAAVALATGVTSLEIGSDIGGSLRHPANFCGVHALKPTWGALSLRGQVPPLPGRAAVGDVDLAVTGPMARTADDLRLLFEVLQGAPTQRGPVAGLRIALWLDEPGFAVSTEVRAAVEHAAGLLREQGLVVELANPPIPGNDLLDTYLAILLPIIADGLPEAVLERMRAGRADALAAVAAGAPRYGQARGTVLMTADPAAVAAARDVRAGMKDAVGAWFGEWDAVLAPISPVPAFTHRQEGNPAGRVLDVDGAEQPYQHLFDWIAFATALHLPAVAAPATRTASGLPVGVQLIGPWQREERLLDLAEALERAVGVLPGPAVTPGRP